MISIRHMCMCTWRYSNTCKWSVWAWVVIGIKYFSTRSHFHCRFPRFHLSRSDIWARSDSHQASTTGMSPYRFPTALFTVYSILALLKSNRIIAGEKWASYYMPVWHKQSSRNNSPMSLHWSKIPFSCLSYKTELFPRTDCSSRMTINDCW